MRTPSPTWTTEYRHDRRAHAHRCRCCNRVIQAGERVIMAKVADRKTYAVHEACGATPHGSAAWTFADAMAYWGTEHLRALGYKIPLPAMPLAA